jgi:hypothetical protein
MESTAWRGQRQIGQTGKKGDRTSRTSRVHVARGPCLYPCPWSFPDSQSSQADRRKAAELTFACAPFPRPRPVVREAGCGGPPLSFFSSSDMPLRERPQSTDADAWRWDNCKRWCGATKHTLRRSPAWLDAAGVEWVQCVERGEGAASCTRRECSGGGSKRNGFIARDMCVCMCVYVTWCRHTWHTWLAVALGMRLGWSEGAPSGWMKGQDGGRHWQCGHWQRGSLEVGKTFSEAGPCRME